MYDNEKLLEEQKLDECDQGIYPDEGKSSEPKPDYSLEYFAQFCDLIDACGQVSYFFTMKKCLKSNIRKATTVAAAYNHDMKYYTEQLDEWRWKAERSLKMLKFHAKRANVDFDIKSFGDDNTFLNMITLNKQRRVAYKGYLTHNHKLSPKDLEAKYQKRLAKKALH